MKNITKILFFLLVISILATGCQKTELTEDLPAEADDITEDQDIQEIGEVDDTEPEPAADKEPEPEDEVDDSPQVESVSGKFKSEEKSAEEKVEEDIYGGDSAADIFLIAPPSGAERAKFYITGIELSTFRGDKEVLFTGRKEIDLMSGMKIRLAKKLIDPTAYVQLKVFTDHEEAYVTVDGEEYEADFTFDFYKELDRIVEPGQTLAIAFELDLAQSIEKKVRVSQTKEYVLNPNGVVKYTQIIDEIKPGFETGMMTDTEFEATGFTLEKEPWIYN
ncbi:MAG: hypothetical protein KAT43_01520 [Nanoarchaeota archaeon]|nr:hypothetical protein [Nanoarchaeota archaeon]